MTKILLIGSFCLLSSFFYGQTNQNAQVNPEQKDKPAKAKLKAKDAQPVMIQPLTNPEIKSLKEADGTENNNGSRQNNAAPKK